MNEWIPAPVLLILLICILILGPKILRERGQYRKALLLQRYGWWCLLAAFVSEQLFIHFYVNEKIKYQDESFYQFIEKSRAIPLRSWSHENSIVRCEYRTMPYLNYKYDLCIYSNKRDQNKKNVYKLEFHEPHGYLSLIKWNDFHRYPYGEPLFELNENGQVIKDIRKNKTIGDAFKVFMDEWVPAPALLILILIILLFWPRILRRKGQSRQAFIFTRNGWFLLILAIVVEQSFIAFYLNKKVEQQSEVFQHFIEEAKALPEWKKGLYIIKCDYQSILLVYQYEMCLFTAAADSDKKSSEQHKILRVAYPGGLLSYLPLNSGRITWDGENIFDLSPNGEIVNDYRKTLRRM